MNFGKPTIVLAGTATAVLFSTSPDVFVFAQERIGLGEVWRLYTGHFVHFSVHHLLVNAAALTLLVNLMPMLTRWQLAWLGFFTPFLLGAMLYFTRPGLAVYGGLSGWLSGIFVVVAWEHSRREDWVRHLYRVSLALFVMKLIVEFRCGTSLFAQFEDGVVMEPAAHAFGAVIAVVGLILDPQCGFRCSRRLKPFRLIQIAVKSNCSTVGPPVPARNRRNPSKLPRALSSG